MLQSYSLSSMPSAHDTFLSDSGLRARILRIAAVCAATLTLSLALQFTPAALAEWNYLIEHLFYVPVVYAGLRFGWRAGLATAGLAGVGIWSRFPEYAPTHHLEVFVLGLAGVFSGVLAERERRQKRASEETAERLSRVCEELQENFERMKRAERLYALGQLSAGIAHEIRNPLASIAGAVGILRRKRCSEEKATECLEIIHKECQRLNKMLTSFLEFARPRKPNYATISVESVFDSVLGLAEHAVDAAPIVLRREIAAGLTLDCDPEQLKQILLNLVINAIQAMPEGGEVLMSARAEDGNAVIEVRDQGCGVSQEAMEHLYDPFFTTKENGTGLGLPVAHQIAAQLGGVLAARNNPDRGMTFSVRLPLEYQTTHESQDHPSGG